MQTKISSCRNCRPKQNLERFTRKNNLRVAICTIPLSTGTGTHFLPKTVTTGPPLHITTVHNKSRSFTRVTASSRTTREIQPSKQFYKRALCSSPFLRPPFFSFPTIRPLCIFASSLTLNPSPPPFGPCRPDCAGSRENHVRPWQAQSGLAAVFAVA